MKKSSKLIFTPAILLLSFILGMVIASAGQEKTKITQADQLPRRNIALKGDVRQIYHDDAKLKQIADQIYQNATDDLSKFDIQDKSTLISYFSSLALIDFKRGDFAEVLRKSDIIKSLEDKEEERASIGIFSRAYVEAKQASKSNSGDDFVSLFKNAFLKELEAVNPALIKKYVDQTRASLSLLNPELSLSGLATQIQPFIDNGKGNVPESIAFAIVANRYLTDMRYPLKDATLQVLEEWQAKHKDLYAQLNKTDFWKDRNVELKPGIANREVVIAVWDTGVDPKPFSGVLWINKNEIPGNNKDDDANGFTDDVNGIAFDLDNKPGTGPLLEPRKLTYDINDLQRWMKGGMDLQNGLQSDESAEFQQRAMSLKPEEGIPFQEDLSWYSTYAHGTHVAGIAAAGNPSARIMYARLTYDTKVKPRLYTDKTQANMAAMFTSVVNYFKANNVRVVNMSWRYNSSAYETVLALYGVGKDEQDRKAMATKWFEAERSSLRKAFESAPEILFICGSGNENNDSNFADYIPAGIDLPNLITVGAVDDQGKRTAFTSEGKSLDFYANGFEVESFVPGGKRLRFSGTSMASPQVANLAGKIIALKPDLTPEQVVAIMRSTATPDPEGKGLLLINPKAAIESLRQ